MSIKASDLCFRWIKHFDKEATLCHTKTKNRFLNPIAVLRPAFLFCFVIRAWIRPILFCKIFNEANPVVVKSCSALSQFSIKNIPLVNPSPPILNQGIGGNVRLPTRMDGCISKKSALKPFCIIQRFECAPISSLEFNLFICQRSKECLCFGDLDLCGLVFGFCGSGWHT